jgi:hypothetical protein
VVPPGTVETELGFGPTFGVDADKFFEFVRVLARHFGIDASGILNEKEVNGEHPADV